MNTFLSVAMVWWAIGAWAAWVMVAINDFPVQHDITRQFAWQRAVLHTGLALWAALLLFGA